jgi:hypothetical protein
MEVGALAGLFLASKGNDIALAFTIHHDDKSLHTKVPKKYANIVGLDLYFS